MKDQLGPLAARALAAELDRAWPQFPVARFTRGIAQEIAPLELLARVDLLGERLAVALPTPFSDAAHVLWLALESPTFTGWMVWPCGGFVAARGLDHPDVALPLLAGLTPRWSSEFAVRPFVDGQAEVAYQYFQRWSTHEDEHVRRLVSEGTRPRLPWAPVLRGLVADPRRNLPLIDALADDPSQYVRRSVGNHLNDISKDHPDLALDLAEQWTARGEAAAWSARRGLRTLIKRGDRRALTLIGADADTRVDLLELAVERRTVRIGESVPFTITLRLAEHQWPCVVVIDYRIHYAGARAMKAPKVFKLARRRLQPGVIVTIRREHAIDHVSVRRIHPGPHRIDVQVNGTVLGSADFSVVDQDGTAGPP